MIHTKSCWLGWAVIVWIAACTTPQSHISSSPSSKTKASSSTALTSSPSAQKEPLVDRIPLKPTRETLSIRSSNSEQAPEYPEAIREEASPESTDLVIELPLVPAFSEASPPRPLHTPEASYSESALEESYAMHEAYLPLEETNSILTGTFTPQPSDPVQVATIDPLNTEFKPAEEVDSLVYVPTEEIEPLESEPVEEPEVPIFTSLPPKLPFKKINIPQREALKKIPSPEHQPNTIEPKETIPSAFASSMAGIENTVARNSIEKLEALRNIEEKSVLTPTIDKEPETRQEQLINVQKDNSTVGNKELRELKPEFPVEETVTYDIPIVRNQRVDHFINLYLTKYRKALEIGIKRSGRYLATIRRILKEEGMPLDLAYLVAVESNYQARVRSSASAVGFWQFIASTGRRYQMRQNRWLDERMELESSTRAASRYLRYLYDRFGNWEHALAAYNAGEGRVNKTIRRAKKKGLPTDFWSLKKLPRETRGYVPAFMAVTILSKNLEKYNLNHIEQDAPLKIEKITVSTDYSLSEIARRAKIPTKKLAKLNPFLLRGVPPLNQKTYYLYVPKQNKPQLIQSLAANPKPSRQWKLALAETFKSRKMTNLLSKYGDPIYIRVQKGDSLWKLAKKHHTTVSRLLKWNKLKKNSILRIKQRLKVYLPSWEVFAKLEEKPVKIAKRKRRAKTRVITVKPGDTLSELAKRYRVSVKKLLSWNNLRRPQALRAHQKLIVSPPRA